MAPYVGPNCVCTQGVAQQWNFLGASVRSFSASIGYGATPARLTVELIEDPNPTCDGRVKYYLDECLQVQTHTAADTGFFGKTKELIGVPVLFRYGDGSSSGADFEFAGIVSNVEEKDNAGGFDQYSVTIESPTEVLNGLNLILDKYLGATNQVPNLANIYGTFEYGSVADCTVWGNSKNYGAGIPFNNIVSALRVLCGLQTPSSFVGFASYMKSQRILHVPGLTGGQGLLREDDTGYILDLGELPSAPSDYRIPGHNANFLDILSRYADDGGYDFFIELIPCCVSNVVYKIIKVRIIDRTSQPTLGYIDEFITGVAGQCGISSMSKGKQLRNEVMNTFVTGPAKHQVLEVILDTGEPSFITDTGYEWWKISDGQYTGINTKVWDLSSDLITPYWGLDINKNAIKSFKRAKLDGVNYPFMSTAHYEAEVCFNANGFNLKNVLFAIAMVYNMEGAGISLSEAKTYLTRMGYDPTRFSSATTYAQLKTIMRDYEVPEAVQICELELMASMGGQDAWFSHISNARTATFWLIYWYFSSITVSFSSRQRKALGIANLAPVAGLANLLLDKKGKMKPGHILDLSDAFLTDEALEGIAKVYEWVQKYANEYYGRKFMVRIPTTCVVQDPSTLQWKFSLEVTDGGWNEQNNTEYSPVLGIDATSTAMDFFRLDDGRIAPFVRFSGYTDLPDFSQLSEDEYGYIFFYDTGGNVVSSDLWVKVNQQPQIVFGDASTAYDPRIVIEMPQAVTNRFLNTGELTSKRKGLFLNYDLSTQLFHVDLVGSTTALQDGVDRPRQPNEAAITIKNNAEVYGPWYNNSSLGAGATRIDQDEDLAPWNFGSFAALNTAGQAKADMGVTNMYISEGGSFTVPGIPQARLGDELLAYGDNGTYSSGQRLAETRTFTILTDSNFGASYMVANLITTTYYQGLKGPTITNISVNFGVQSVSTTYTLSTYQRKFRRFQQTKLDRLKQIGRLRQEMLSIFKEK